MTEVTQNGRVFPTYSRLKLGWIFLVTFVGLSLTAYCYNYGSGLAQTQPLPHQKEYTINNRLNLTPTATRLQSSYNSSATRHEKESLNKGKEEGATYGGDKEDHENEGRENGDIKLQFKDLVNHNTQTESNYAGGNDGNDDSPTHTTEGAVNFSEGVVAIERNNTGPYQFSKGKFGVIFSEPVTDGGEKMEKLGTEHHVVPNDVNSASIKVIMKPKYNVSDVSEGVKPSIMNGSQSSHEIKVFTKNKLGNFSKPVADAQPLQRFEKFAHLADTSKPHCNIKLEFNSWKKGVATQMGIPINCNCRKLSIHSRPELARVKAQVIKWRREHPWMRFAEKFTGSCDIIREEFSNNFYVSPVEKEFPIAYILVVYTNAGQVIRFLKAIYRPQNTYCIHPDARQGEKFAGIFQAISRCLDNVFVVSRPISVYYAHHSLIQAQLNCMDDLLKRPNGSWKYVINLCGREVPLKTNREIVESLAKLKGYSGLLVNRLTPFWWRSRFMFKHRLGRDGSMHRMRARQKWPPYRIQIYKSLTFLAASYAFVDFIVNDKRAQALSNYLRSVYSPEEHFYASLYELSYARGAKPKKDTVAPIDIPEINRVNWVINRYHKSHLSSVCPGRRVVHVICILTAPDMKNVLDGRKIRRPTFFFNKYFLEWDPTVMDCMEETLVEANILEYWKDCIAEKIKT